MKSRHPRLLLITIGLAIATASCSSMRQVSMNAMRPADVAVPSHIQTLVVVDRTKARSKELGIVEGLLTGELPGQDKVAVQAGIQALQRSMQRSPRFEVKVGAERLRGNSLTLALPDPLSWKKVDALARAYGADGVLAVELFDSDFVVTRGVRQVTEKVTEDGKIRELEVDQYFASGKSDVRMGFRLYDPQGRSIVDARIYPDTRSWEAVGKSPREALDLLISNSDAARACSEGAAASYAERIAPMPIRISRSFYAKSKKVPAIASGSRMADVGRWQDAAGTWQAAIATAPSDEAGQLAYNVAVANEVQGDLDAAITWAERSYVTYGNKKARDYVRLLKQRAHQEDRVQAQLQ